MHRFSRPHRLAQTRYFSFTASRRRFTQLALASGLPAVSGWFGSTTPAHAQTPTPAGTAVLRIGFQKSASLLVLQKAKGTLEQALAPLGFAVKWTEFPAGPQLLEGLNIGAVDVGYVGEAPPIFGQAAGAQFVYIGYDPAAPRAEAILVRKDSPLQSVAELKGRKVALNKGSNVHYLLLRQLESNGLAWRDIQPIYLAPADGRAAFETARVDAWVIWDPFQAAAEQALGARILADGTPAIAPNRSFYLAQRDFAQQQAAVIAAFFQDSVAQGAWLKANLRAAAELIAPQQGLPVEVLEVALARAEFNVQPVTAAVIADQQQIADAFHRLKLIPKPIRVADAQAPGTAP